MYAGQILPSTHHSTDLHTRVSNCSPDNLSPPLPSVFRYPEVGECFPGTNHWRRPPHSQCGSSSLVPPIHDSENPILQQSVVIHSAAKFKSAEFPRTIGCTASFVIPTGRLTSVAFFGSTSFQTSSAWLAQLVSAPTQVHVQSCL